MCEFGTFRARFVRLSVVACDDLGFYTKSNPHEILALDPRYLELIKSTLLNSGASPRKLRAQHRHTTRKHTDRALPARRPSLEKAQIIYRKISAAA